MAADHDAGIARYRLAAFIVHKGTSVHCGHYVSCIQDNFSWILFNDDRVTKWSMEDQHVLELMQHAYIYLFERVDNQ
jgi:ubiquitin carboxyl-terminal hydrolase 5/13